MYWRRSSGSSRRRLRRRRTSFLRRRCWRSGMAPDRCLEGRVAIVTGAAGRLGPTWCRALAEAGARVVGIDLVEADGVRAADVTDRAALDRIADEVEREHGTPEILVNGAGIDQPPDAAAMTRHVEDVSLDDFRRTLDVNLAGTFAAT